MIILRVLEVRDRNTNEFGLHLLLSRNKKSSELSKSVEVLFKENVIRWIIYNDNTMLQSCLMA